MSSNNVVVDELSKIDNSTLIYIDPTADPDIPYVANTFKLNGHTLSGNELNLNGLDIKTNVSSWEGIQSPASLTDSLNFLYNEIDSKTATLEDTISNLNDNLIKKINDDIQNINIKIGSVEDEQGKTTIYGQLKTQNQAISDLQENKLDLTGGTITGPLTLKDSLTLEGSLTLNDNSAAVSSNDLTNFKNAYIGTGETGFPLLDQIKALETRVGTLETENASLKGRVEALEETLENLIDLDGVSF